MNKALIIIIIHIDVILGGFEILRNLAKITSFSKQMFDDNY